MIISRTPFRISFFGGGTDYPAWYRQHGGSVLATTIDKYCYLTCRYLPPFFDHRIRIVYSDIEMCQRAEEIKHPAVREVLSFLGIKRGVEIHHDGDLPARSGMGSSSAFTVGLLNALYALKGVMPSKPQLARESILVEQERLKEVVGSQDQVMAAYGGLNHVTFLPNGEISVRPVTLPAERINELKSHLLMFYSGVKRTASQVASTYANDLEARRQQLRIMSDFVDEGLSILSGREDITRFGVLLREAWETKQSLSAKVSNPYVDELFAAALGAGAIGGKLTGAGGGGFLLLFVPPASHQKVREALRRLLWLPFDFEFSGSQIIFYTHERDYEIYERLREQQRLEPSQELGAATRRVGARAAPRRPASRRRRVS